MANVTKRELVVRISDETGVPQHKVFDVVQKTLDYIAEGLGENKNVELRNFGVFEVRLTKQRVGRNPKKPEKDFVIPARATVKFKAGKLMRQKVEMLSTELQREADQD